MTQGSRDRGEPRNNSGSDQASPRLVALEIADELMNSGLMGISLSKLLHERFPTANRSEVFLGVAIFATDLHAERLLALAELQAGRGAPTREEA